MKKLHLPCTKEELENLKVGEKVLLSGIIYTARDAAHKKLKELYDSGEKLPLELQNQAIYYVGPTQTPPYAKFGSAGPTTATRMDAYTPLILSLGANVIIGKGKRSLAVKNAFVENKSVYLIAVGGAGALLGQCVQSEELIAFEELQSEAIRKLEIVDFPVFVGIDLLGNDIYE